MRRHEGAEASLMLLEAAAAGGSSTSIGVGRVLADADDDGSLVVEIAGKPRRAAMAVGCVIRPIDGDRVLVFCDTEETFVLSVLERSGPNCATLALPGRGNLAIEGETISLAASQRMSLKAETLDLQGKVLALIGEKTTWLSKTLTAVVERWRSSAKTQEVSADTLTVKAIDRIAIIDRVDSLKATAQAVKISGVSSETAQSKVIVVTDDLRFDGKRVTVG